MSAKPQTCCLGGFCLRQFCPNKKRKSARDEGAPRQPDGPRGEAPEPKKNE